MARPDTEVEARVRHLVLQVVIRVIRAAARDVARGARRRLRPPLEVKWPGGRAELRATLRQHGVAREAFERRVQLGWRLTEAATTLMRGVGAVVVVRGRRELLADVLERRGVDRGLYEARLRAGWPPSVAATTRGRGMSWTRRRGRRP